MNPKIVIALAVIAGILAVFMVQRHVDNLRGETKTVFKATTNLKKGDVVGGAMEKVSIPAGLFPALLKEAPQAELLDFVRTTALRQPVAAGDVLMFRHFSSSIDQGVLPEIPPGMKAISISVSQESAVSYFIQPGDLVDVMGTLIAAQPTADGMAAGARQDVSTRPILQAVRVLAVGEQYRRSSRQLMDAYSSVTLLVSMEEAAKLIFARDFLSANMTLILRGEGDDSVQSRLPEVGVETLDFDRIGNSPASQAEQ
ncbi:Flp pilus assembly protein CpaB [bacterium]|nr:Flp pilus assembly protein CpaB [bacterium]